MEFTDSLSPDPVTHVVPGLYKTKSENINNFDRSSVKWDALRRVSVQHTDLRQGFASSLTPSQHFSVFSTRDKICCFQVLTILKTNAKFPSSTRELTVYFASFSRRGRRSYHWHFFADIQITQFRRF